MMNSHSSVGFFPYIPPFLCLLCVRTAVMKNWDGIAKQDALYCLYRIAHILYIQNIIGYATGESKRLVSIHSLYTLHSFFPSSFDVVVSAIPDLSPHIYNSNRQCISTHILPHHTNITSLCTFILFRFRSHEPVFLSYYRVAKTLNSELYPETLLSGLTSIPYIYQLQTRCRRSLFIVKRKSSCPTPSSLSFTLDVSDTMKFLHGTSHACMQIKW